MINFKLTKRILTKYFCRLSIYFIPIYFLINVFPNPNKVGYTFGGKESEPTLQYNSGVELSPNFINRELKKYEDSDEKDFKMIEFLKNIQNAQKKEVMITINNIDDLLPKSIKKKMTENQKKNNLSHGNEINKKIDTFNFENSFIKNNKIKNLDSNKKSSNKSKIIKPEINNYNKISFSIINNIKPKEFNELKEKNCIRIELLKNIQNGQKNGEAIINNNIDDFTHEAINDKKDKNSNKDNLNYKEDIKPTINTSKNHKDIIKGNKELNLNKNKKDEINILNSDINNENLSIENIINTKMPEKSNIEENKKEDIEENVEKTDNLNSLLDVLSEVKIPEEEINKCIIETITNKTTEINKEMENINSKDKVREVNNNINTTTPKGNRCCSCACCGQR